MRLLGEKRKILQKGPVSRACPGQGSYRSTWVDKASAAREQVLCSVLCTAVRTHRLAGPRGMVYLLQRGRMQELGGSCERRVAEWPSDD